MASDQKVKASNRINRMLRSTAAGDTGTDSTEANQQNAPQPNSLCPGPCLEASADTFIYQGTYAYLFVPRPEKTIVGEHHHIYREDIRGTRAAEHVAQHTMDWRALIRTIKGAVSADQQLTKTLEDNLPESPEPLFQLGILFRERIRTRPMGYTIERAPFYEIAIPPGDMVTLTQRSFSRRTRSLQEEEASETEQKLELSSSFTTEMHDELTRVIENSTQWSEWTSASAGIGYSIYSASLGATSSTSVSRMDTDTQRQMRRLVEEAVRKIESRQKSTHKTVMEVTSEESLANESIRVLHNYSTSLKKVYMRRLLQVLHVTHERYDAQLCWAPCVDRPKETFGITSEAAEHIEKIRESYKTRVPPEGTLSVATPADKQVDVDDGHFGDRTDDHRHIQRHISVPAGYEVKSVQAHGDGGNAMFLMPNQACPKGQTENYPNPIGSTASSVEIFVHLGKSTLSTMNYSIEATLSPTQQWIDEYDVALQAWREAESQKEVDAYIASLSAGADEFKWSPHIVMRKVIETYLAGDGSAALPDFSADPGCPLIELMHALFEWENMSIRFFPPAWSKVEGYQFSTTVDNSSAAKLYIPVRKGMEAEAVGLLASYGAIPDHPGAVTAVGKAITELNTLITNAYDRAYQPVLNEDQDILAPNDISLTERGERAWRNQFEEEGHFQIVDRFVTTVPTDGVDFEEGVTACPIAYPKAPSGSGNGTSGNGGSADDKKDDDRGGKKDDDRDDDRDNDHD